MKEIIKYILSAVAKKKSWAGKKVKDEKAYVEIRISVKTRNNRQKT